MQVKTRATNQKSHFVFIDRVLARLVDQAEHHLIEEVRKYRARGKFSIQINQTEANHEYSTCLDLLLKHGLADVSNRRAVKHAWPKSYIVPAQDASVDLDIEGLIVNVRLFFGEAAPEGKSSDEVSWRTLELTVPIDDRDKLSRLIEEKILYTEDEAKGLKVYLYDGTRRSWFRSIQNPRPLETVVLPTDQKARITGDIDTFISNEKAYAAVGLPWHRGYLLHGAPGTGKSALAKAIASHWGFDLYVLSLAELKGDFDLTAAITDITPKSVLLLEDIDVFSQTKRDVHENAGATFAGLLNILDGVFTPHGLIKIMTSNSEVASFDPALIRDGRIDMIEHIAHANEHQTRAILQHFYGTGVREINLGGSTIAPAAVVGAIKRNVDDIEAAIQAIERASEGVTDSQVNNS